MTSLARHFSFVRLILAASMVVAFTCSGAVAVGQSTSAPAPAKSVAPPQASISQTSQKAVVSDSSKPPAAAGEEQAEKSKDDASNQGIRVHGHWIIDVRNPDGTLAEHRDFQNSLTGSNTMVGLLFGNFVPSDFLIYLNGTTPPCVVGAGYNCDIVHNLTVYPAAARCGNDYCATGLTITPTFGNSPALVLAGNLTATQAGNINIVGTYMGICGSNSNTLTTVSPASCAAGNSIYGYGGLTQTNVSTINIVSGQIIQVTVTITFS